MNTKERRRWPWIVAAATIALATIVMVKRGGSATKDVDSSLIVSVKRADLRIEVVETGKVQPREKVEVKSKVAGQVARVLVKEGDPVKKGQLLLQLDPTDFRREVARTEAEVGRATAEVAQAKNGLAFAKTMLERRQRAFETKGTSQVDVDVAENDVRVKTVALQTAESVLAAAKVANGAAEDRLRYTQIVSPMDGTVIQRGIEAGEVVTPGVQATFEGKPLLTIADLSTLIVKADLNQIDVAKVKMAQPVTLTLDALPGRKYDAKVTKIAPASVVPKGGTIEVFPVEATLEKADAAIKPGMTADVRIHVETRANVMALPIEALLKESGKNFVTKISNDDKGRQKQAKGEVQLGVRNDRDVEITSGIAEGERILIKPASAAENEMK